MISLGSLLQAMGGLGIFLIGMIVMTDALRQLAGDSVRVWLMRFTRSPVSGVVTGAASTALLQSSSATTVAAVGFVGAGLITFPAALGIVFGANLGTTITGWIVTVVGFKLNLIGLMYPCILLGALLRLFAAQRMASVGLALAGFGLIFVGIDQLQAGMQGMQSFLSGIEWRSESYPDRAKLVGLGVVFTIITQSSSAGVAAVLAALFAEAISLGQGLALVIGMDIGTTVTAAMAAIGGATGSRRTALSHVIYNIMTGCMAFVLISPYVLLLDWLVPDARVDEPELALVAFHSGFNLLGVLLVLPFTAGFAAFIERIVPEHDNAFTSQLDTKLREDPVVAVRAARGAVVEQLAALFGQVELALDDRASAYMLDKLDRAIEQTQKFLTELNPAGASEGSKQLTALLHALDHMGRLSDRCRHVEPPYKGKAEVPELLDMTGRLKSALGHQVAMLEQSRFAENEDYEPELLEAFKQFEHPFRSHVINRVAEGEIDIQEADTLLDRARWLLRVNRHIGKIVVHLNSTA